MKHCTDLNLLGSLHIYVLSFFSDSELYLLNGLDFYFRQRDSENQLINSPVFQYPVQNGYQAL